MKGNNLLFSHNQMLRFGSHARFEGVLLWFEHATAFGACRIPLAAQAAGQASLV